VKKIAHGRIAFHNFRDGTTGTGRDQLVLVASHPCKVFASCSEADQLDLVLFASILTSPLLTVFTKYFKPCFQDRISFSCNLKNKKTSAYDDKQKLLAEWRFNL
jgi:hypothetical protein